MAKPETTEKPALKSYLVRDGFNYQTPIKTPDGGTTWKTYESGEVVNLPEFNPSLMPHQLEELTA